MYLKEENPSYASFIRWIKTSVKKDDKVFHPPPYGLAENARNYLDIRLTSVRVPQIFLSHR